MTTRHSEWFSFFVRRFGRACCSLLPFVAETRTVVALLCGPLVGIGVLVALAPGQDDGGRSSWTSLL